MNGLEVTNQSVRSIILAQVEIWKRPSAVEMFLRSIEKHNLIYSTFVDGDSSSFKQKCHAKYRDVCTVAKEECVGYVQKCHGAALRHYKITMKGKSLPNGRKVGGQGRLTDNVVDKMQTSFYYAIIWAVFHHSICSAEPLAAQHRYCPTTLSANIRFLMEILMLNIPKREEFLRSFVMSCTQYLEGSLLINY